MAKMLFALTFLEDVETICSPHVRKHLESVLSMIETFPESGPLVSSECLTSKHGGEVRRCDVAPFCIVYTYERSTDTVRIRGLVLQRSTH
jgi:mRNA-degrading endonuclease RelE of RelBE toxin-antitoxin system